MQYNGLLHILEFCVQKNWIRLFSLIRILVSGIVPANLGTHVTARETYKLIIQSTNNVLTLTVNNATLNYS